MKVLKMLFWVPIIVITIYLILLGYIYFNQANMVFYPSDNFSELPEQYGLKYEDIIVKINDSTTLHGWFFPSKDSSQKKVVLFCHGNAGNISNRLPTAKYLHDMGLAVLMFDYRGYGKSTGRPTEEGVYQDAEKCFEWLILTKQYQPQSIYLFGRSLGGAVAVELALRVISGGLIVESSFTTVGNLAKNIYPIFPINTLIKYSFNSIDKISQIQIPIIVTHSPNDDLIPYTMGEELFIAAVEPKQFVVLSGGHNSRTYFDDPLYKKALQKLFKIEISN